MVWPLVLVLATLLLLVATAWSRQANP